MFTPLLTKSLYNHIRIDSYHVTMYYFNCRGLLLCCFLIKYMSHSLSIQRMFMNFSLGDFSYNLRHKQSYFSRTVDKWCKGDIVQMQRQYKNVSTFIKSHLLFPIDWMHLVVEKIQVSDFLQKESVRNALAMDGPYSKYLFERRAM